MIKIHNFPRGARGLRVMWLCEEMELPYEVEKVTFPPSETYRSLHPLGSVPFLEDDGVAISESVAMLFYLAQKYGPTPLLPAKEDPAFAPVLQMTVFSEATIGAALNTLMAAHFRASAEDKRNWSVRGVEARLDQALDFVVAMLGGNEFLAGGRLTLADLAICTAFGVWQGALGKTMPEKIAVYRARLTERPAYQRARTKCQG